MSLLPLRAWASALVASSAGQADSSTSTGSTWSNTSRDRPTAPNRGSSRMPPASQSSSWRRSRRARLHAAPAQLGTTRRARRRNTCFASVVLPTPQAPHTASALRLLSVVAPSSPLPPPPRIKLLMRTSSISVNSSANRARYLASLSALSWARSSRLVMHLPSASAAALPMLYSSCSRCCRCASRQTNEANSPPRW